MGNKRSFTIVKIEKPAQKTAVKKSLKKTSGEGGRFVSSTPSGAARKAFNKACREKNIKGQCTLVVTLQETTKGGSGKIYKYKLKRIKRDKPLLIEKGDVTVEINYETVIESMNKK